MQIYWSNGATICRKDVAHAALATSICGLQLAQCTAKSHSLEAMKQKHALGPRRAVLKRPYGSLRLW